MSNSKYRALGIPNCLLPILLVLPTGTVRVRGSQLTLIKFPLCGNFVIKQKSSSNYSLSTCGLRESLNTSIYSSCRIDFFYFQYNFSIRPNVCRQNYHACIPWPSNLRVNVCVSSYIRSGWVGFVPGRVSSAQTLDRIKAERVQLPRSIAPLSRVMPQARCFLWRKTSVHRGSFRSQT